MGWVEWVNSSLTHTPMCTPRPPCCTESHMHMSLGLWFSCDQHHRHSGRGHLLLLAEVLESWWLAWTLHMALPSWAQPSAQHWMFVDVYSPRGCGVHCSLLSNLDGNMSLTGYIIKGQSLWILLYLDPLNIVSQVTHVTRMQRFVAFFPICS